MNDLFRYDGKRALVVGCATGMGAAVAQAVQLLGGEVHGVDYRKPDYELASFADVDLRDEAQVDAVLAGLEGPFHAVFYCAGLSTTHPSLDIMRVNYIALRKIVDGVRPLVPSGGAIAIIASNGGLRFLEHLAQARELMATDGSYAAAEAWIEANAELVAEGYGFSKECAIIFTMLRALDVVDDGIRINCISPGTTDTPMLPEFKASAPPGIIEAFYGPMGRPARPEEMGWPLVFLNSDAASFLTGQNLIIDGGFVAGVTTGSIDLNEIFAKAGLDLGS